MNPKKLRNLGTLEIIWYTFLILEKKNDSPERTPETRALEKVLGVWAADSLQRQQWEWLGKVVYNRGKKGLCSVEENVMLGYQLRLSRGQSALGMVP